MATDFWASTHYKRWIIDRATLKQARAEDLYYADDPDYLEYFAIYFANVITKLGKKLQLRQRVIATATVFFRRFYIKNSYCETDPFMVIAACLYVAAKAEESPIHIKNMVAESRALFSQNYKVKNFPSDNSKLAEMEFYLVDDLDCDLTVFHPYRTLLALCHQKRESGNEDTDHDVEMGTDFEEEGEAGELGVGIDEDDGPRYWGTGDGKLELTGSALQTAWFIINDTYRSDLCLLYPPHLIAIAAIYLTFTLHPPPLESLSASSSSTNLSSSQILNSPPSSPQVQQQPQPRRSSRQAAASSSSSSIAETTPKKRKTTADPLTFLAYLNVSLPTIATIAQEIIGMYTLWERYREDLAPDAPSTKVGQSRSPAPSPIKDSRCGSVVASVGGSTGTLSGMGTPVDAGRDEGGEYITPSFLSGVLLRMREAKLMDVIQQQQSLNVGGGSGRHSVAINKMLERTQAVG